MALSFSVTRRGVRRRPKRSRAYRHAVAVSGAGLRGFRRRAGEFARDGSVLAAAAAVSRDEDDGRIGESGGVRARGHPKQLFSRAEHVIQPGLRATAFARRRAPRRGGGTNLGPRRVARARDYFTTRRNAFTRIRYRHGRTGFPPCSPPPLPVRPPRRTRANMFD